MRTGRSRQSVLDGLVSGAVGSFGSFIAAGPEELLVTAALPGWGSTAGRAAATSDLGIPHRNDCSARPAGSASPGKGLTKLRPVT